MKCCDNNRASTVKSFFIDGVRACGLPSRVRSDRGGENVDVARFMLELPLRGPGRASFITVRSVHNQRIKQMWRDVFTQCTVLFYRLFSYVEASGVLDINDKVRLFCLRCIFIPRINGSLLAFKNAWKSHSLSSEGYVSPNQL